MREEYSTHKYDQPITGYMDTVVMGNSGYDEMTTHPGECSEGAALIGKRVLWWDEQGFVWSEKFKDADAAKVEFGRVEQEYYRIVQQWQLECMHRGTNTNECSHCDAELNGELQGKSVKVAGHEGIAWRVLTDTGERVTLHMIGDDQVHKYEKEEVTVLEDDEYCHECGQIGCSW